MTTADRAPGEGFLVLWAGGADPREPEVQAGLRDAGVRVEDTGLDALSERANRRAPDLIVLAGAAGGAPAALVERLAGTSPASSVPVVAIGPEEHAQTKARSRFGLVARFSREEDAPALTQRLVTLLRGLSRRPARWRVPVQGDQLPVVAARLSAAGRVGLLASPDEGALALASAPGSSEGPSTERLLVALSGANEVELTFHERPPERIRIARAAPSALSPSALEGLADARILVIDDEPARGDALRERLVEAGAEARAVSVTSEAIQAGRGLDPTVVIVSAEALITGACRPLWQDPRLATAGLLVLDPLLVDSGDPAADPPEAFATQLAALCSAEVDLLRRLRAEEAVAERLSTLGTARWLKVLGRCAHDVTFRVFAASGRGRVDLSGGKIQGASFRPTDARASVIEGKAAVQSLLGLPFGRVLAGPPSGLARLEGVRPTRKASVVGRIAVQPTPPEGQPRRGLIAEEVVIQRVGVAARVQTPRPIPSRATVPTGEASRKLGPSLTRSTVASEARREAADARTEIPRANDLDAMDALRAQLRRGVREQMAWETGPDDDEENGDERDEDEDSSVVAAETDEERVPEDAVAPLEARAGLGDAASDSPGSEAPRAKAPGSERPPSERPRSERPPSERPRSERPPAERPPAERPPAERPPSERPPAERPPAERRRAAATGSERSKTGSTTGGEAAGAQETPAGAPDERARARKPGAAPQLPSPAAAPPRGTPAWLLAVAALAVILGAFAAWRFATEPSGPEPGGSTDRGHPEVAGHPETASRPAHDLTPTTVSTPAPVAPSPRAAQSPAAAQSPTEAQPPSEAPSESPDVPSTATAPEGRAEGPSPEPPAAVDPGERAGAEAPSADLDPAATIDSLLRESSQAIRARDFERSEALARQVLAREPGSSRGMYRLAVALFRQQRIDEALTWADNAHQADPRDPLPLALRGDLLMRTGRFHAAAIVYREVLEIEPEFGPAQRMMDRLRERGVVTD